MTVWRKYEAGKFWSRTESKISLEVPQKGFNFAFCRNLLKRLLVVSCSASWLSVTDLVQNLTILSNICNLRVAKMIEKSTIKVIKTRLAEQINHHWTTSPNLGLKSHHGDSCGVAISLQNSHLTRQWYDIHETSGGSGLIRVNPTCLLSEDISHSPFCLRAKRNKHKYHLALLIQKVVKCMKFSD